MPEDDKDLERRLRLTPSFQWDSIRTLQERYLELEDKLEEYMWKLIDRIEKLEGAT